MAEVVHKGGYFIVQDESQKGLEATYLALFVHHKLGVQWMCDNGIMSKKHRDDPDPVPDFVFEVPGRPTIGLEIVNFIHKSNKNDATMRLERVAKKVVDHFKQQGFPLTLLIDVYDPRKWSPKLSDHMDLRIKPGFSHLSATDDELKNAFISVLDLEEIKKNGITKRPVTIKGQTFIVNGSQMHAPNTHYHVNNEGWCVENPFDEIQRTIDSKNKKFESYKAHCDECDLLIVVDGGFVHFDDKLQKHEFNSAFRNVFLIDLSFGCRVVKLNIRSSLNALS